MKSRPLLPWIGLILAVAAMILLACGPGATSDEPSLGSPGSDIVIPDDAQEIVAAATQDLAEYLNVDPAEVRVVGIEAVDWPDSSLGCPKPNIMYAEAVSPGYKIVLEAQGQQHVYHTGTERFVRCDMASAAEVPGQATRMDAAAIQVGTMAQTDLSQQLGIPHESVTLVSMETIQWPDASLGCPDPDKMYAQVVTPGYRIVISAEGEEYVYHADNIRVKLCEE